MIQDDASDWFASQGQEIQDYEAPELPEFDDAESVDAETIDDERPYGDVPEVTNDDVRNMANMRAIAQPTAEVIVGTLDVVMPLLISIMIRGSEREESRLTEGERETLTEAWATYLGDKNVSVSPGVALSVAMITVYGAKVISALESRRQRRELEEARRQVEELRGQLTEASRQIEELKKRPHDEEA